MDWSNLREQTVKALEKSLSDILSRNSKEQFYAIALYTDSSAMTIGLAVNSLEALEAKLEAEDEEDREDCMSYYKWATSEWVYEGWGGKDFEGVCMFLRSSEERKDFDGFREKVISLMINALNDVGGSVFLSRNF